MTTTTTTTTPTSAPGIKVPGVGDFFQAGTPLDKAAHVAGANRGLIIALFCVLMVVATIYYWLKDYSNRGGIVSSGGLNYVIGPMGSGKSMFGVRTMVAALVNDRYVISNVRLLPGWAEKVCEKYFGGDWRAGGERRARTVARLEALYVYESSLRQAMRFRLPCAECGDDVNVCGHVGPHQEARGVFVWDETHNDLNNRDYQGHGFSKEEREYEKERRRLVIRWATQLRKLGFSGYLLSQHHENTDAQLRRVCNNLIRLQNQRNAEGLWLARLLPRRWAVFLVYWYPAHLATGVPEHMIKPIRFERYVLPWCRVLYDSWETFHGINETDSDDSPIQLPAGGWYRELPASAGAPAPAGVGAADSDDTPDLPAAA